MITEGFGFWHCLHRTACGQHWRFREMCCQLWGDICVQVDAMLPRHDLITLKTQQHVPQNFTSANRLPYSVKTQEYYDPTNTCHKNPKICMYELPPVAR